MSEANPPLDSAANGPNDQLAKPSAGFTSKAPVGTIADPRRKKPTRSRAIVALTAVGLAIAVALPFVLSGFTTFQLTEALIFAIAILGLNLLTGINGQFSLGHSAFFAVGAYVTAIGVGSFGMPWLLTLPIAALVAFVFGFLFGFPALRLEGIYLALATFSLAVATPTILKSSILSPWTNGVGGLLVDKPYKAPFGLPLSGDQWLYFIVLIIAVLCALAARNLVHSRSGRAMRAIRDNPIAASAMGVDTRLYKTVTFGLSAMFAGLAGGLSAVVIGFVAPDSFTLVLSIGFFVGMVVGGTGSILGSLVGGLFILYVPIVAERVSTGAAGAIYGAILIAVIYLAPTGAAGLVRRIGAWRRTS